MRWGNPPMPSVGFCGREFSALPASPHPGERSARRVNSGHRGFVQFPLRFLTVKKELRPPFHSRFHARVCFGCPFVQDNDAYAYRYAHPRRKEGFYDENRKSRGFEGMGCHLEATSKIRTSVPCPAGDPD